MHFSIPDTEEYSGNGGSVYMGYNIHINGIFHCSVRYRQLLNLHEQIRRDMGPSVLLPPFPPKKLLPLSPNQLEDRRSMLEKYIQTISQDNRISKSELFVGFLLAAQIETSKENNTLVNCDVFFMNDKRVSVEISATEPSNSLLLSVCQKIRLPAELSHYFSLYIMKKENTGEISVIKKLEDFESPYISMKYIEEACYIVFRKSFWDVNMETDLLEHDVAVNFLYIQAAAEIECGWVLADADTRELLRQTKDKREYLEIARGLKYYGYIQFKPCWCDYPRPGTRVFISAGNRELNFRVQLLSTDEAASTCSSSSDSGTEVIREGSFRVTRMRCWRITTLHNGESSAVMGGQEGGARLELAFEYLMCKDKLQWITICSDQAILMSTCLQDMVAELLMKKNGGIPTKTLHRLKSWSYIRRDGSMQKFSPLSKSISTDGFSDTSQSSRSLDSTDTLIENNKSSIRRLSEKLSNVSVKSKPSPPINPFVENDAFEGIGDEDL